MSQKRSRRKVIAYENLKEGKVSYWANIGPHGGVAGGERETLEWRQRNSPESRRRIVDRKWSRYHRRVKREVEAGGGKNHRRKENGGKKKPCLP